MVVFLRSLDKNAKPKKRNPSKLQCLSLYWFVVTDGFFGFFVHFKSAFAFFDHLTFDFVGFAGRFIKVIVHSPYGLATCPAFRGKPRSALDVGVKPTSFSSSYKELSKAFRAMFIAPTMSASALYPHL